MWNLKVSMSNMLESVLMRQWKHLEALEELLICILRAELELWSRDRTAEVQLAGNVCASWVQIGVFSLKSLPCGMLTQESAIARGGLPRDVS